MDRAADQQSVGLGEKSPTGEDIALVPYVVKPVFEPEGKGCEWPKENNGNIKVLLAEMIS